jgi:hypothetical protein
MGNQTSIGALDVRALTAFAVLAGTACSGVSSGPLKGPASQGTGDGTTQDGGSLVDGAGPGGGSDATMGVTGVDGSSPAEGGQGGPIDAGPIVAPQPVSKYIVVDQFGYLPSAEKIAVLRSPKTGFDSSQSYTAGARYALVDAHSSARVLEAAPTVWNGGATDTSSGDKAWWFDFSTVTTAGDYFVLDETANVRSPVFSVSKGVYRNVLTQAMRMFYYQRDGIAKDAKYAGADWADGVAHPQDSMCGLYSDGSGKQDLHGGWFDAGDQNRYTAWAGGDVIELLRAYVENKSVWTDDYDIPESGNGVPDILDEIKWELDWMVRMQQPDGSLLSIASHTGASPPSTDTSPCKYGSANTGAALSAAAAFAYASLVYGSAPGVSAAYPGFATSLATKAGSAWTWALANPNVSFSNQSAGIGGGEQNITGNDLALKKLQAAVFLFELTGSSTYKTVVDGGYTMLESNFDPFHMEPIDTALEYASLSGATTANAQAISSWFKTNVEGSGFFGKLASGTSDPYLAYLSVYTWGSNQVKAGQGNMFADVSAFAIDPSSVATANKYAARYVHYIHGVNPLGVVYLSNMSDAGATSSVTRFFHTWFAHGSMWDAVGVSKYGPPPGYLTGGPNPGYTWDGCCPSGCGSTANNALCGTAQPSPPSGQPAQKSYKDFNDSWPLDSWSVTEPDLGYQAQYIRLLSKFVQ